MTRLVSRQPSHERRATRNEKMPRLRTKAGKERLLRRVRKQRLKSVTILPSLITILNGVFGFAAIIFAGEGEFVKAGYMVLLAMLADMLDGRLARMSQNTSSFGGQLDSLCDMVSFGVAPVFLMYQVLGTRLESSGFTGESFSQRFIWLASAAYMCCAAIRLARFNVENEEDESAHMSFVGLPSPAAAGVIVSLVIFNQEALPELAEKNTQFYTFCDSAIIYTLPALALGAAVLMVSRMRYPHIVNQYIKGKKPLSHLIRILLLLAFVYICKIPTAMVLAFCGFAASGFVKWLYSKVARKKGAVPHQDEAGQKLLNEDLEPEE